MAVPPPPQCPPHLGLWRGTWPGPYARYALPPQSTKGFGGTSPSLVFLCTLSYTEQYTLFSTVYLITHYTPYDHYWRGQTMKMLMSWWLGTALLARMTIISLRVNVKTHTISFTFTLLQSNNPISIQILNKFRNWRVG